MAVDRTNFLRIAGALAAGGVGGWTLRDRSPKADAPAPPPPPAAAASATAPEGPVSVDIVPPISSAATCDDTVGSAEECPSVGPSDEGVCSNIIFKRCGDFKSRLQAQGGSSCDRLLTPTQRERAVRSGTRQSMWARGAHDRLSRAFASFEGHVPTCHGIDRASLAETMIVPDLAEFSLFMGASLGAAIP